MDNFAHYQELGVNEFKKFSQESFETFHSQWSYSFLKQLSNKKHNKTKFKLKQIEPLESEIPILFFDKTNWDVSKKEEIIYDRTGLYHVVFEENDKEYHLIYCCFMGKTNEQLQLIVTNPNTLIKIKEIIKDQKKRQLKPALGIFSGDLDDNKVLHYVKFEKQMSKKIIHHSSKKEVEDDINYFFSNIERTIANKEKGTRKILIAGNQGTGKSTFIQELTLNHKGSKSIMYAKNLEVWVKHQELCSKYGIPCISVVEDSENLLDDRNSSLLNFLSGSLEYVNKKGSYTIFTTNHPEQLSDRIKHRPERIDDVFIISNLSESDALIVAKDYFSKFLPETFDYNSFKGLFTDCTGAEIMKYAEDIKKEANFKLGDFSKVDLKFIKEIMKLQENKYDKLSKINSGKTKLAKQGKGLSNDIGFGGNRTF